MPELVKIHVLKHVQECVMQSRGPTRRYASFHDCRFIGSDHLCLTCIREPAQRGYHGPIRTPYAVA